MKSLSLYLRLFIILGPLDTGFTLAFEIMDGPPDAPPPVTFLLPIDMKEGLANAPPLPLEMPKLGLLVTFEVPEPAIYGLIAGLAPEGAA